MSGHSHFATIKRKKAANDAQKSRIFSKLAREISVAAKEGGGDPDTNATLRQVVEKAKSLNMPTDNIERAIRKGTGQEPGTSWEEMLLEAYGPGAAALLITAITDNRNRTAGEVRQILSRHRGKAVESGSVRWMFERKGILLVPTEEDREGVELAAIESGAEDIRDEGEGVLEVRCAAPDLDRVRTDLAARGFHAESASLAWVPSETVALEGKDAEDMEALLEGLDNHDDVQGIYTNWA